MHSFHIPPPMLSWGVFIPSPSANRGLSMKRASPIPPWVPQAKRRRSVDNDREKCGQQSAPPPPQAARPLPLSFSCPVPRLLPFTTAPSQQAVFPEAEALTAPALAAPCQRPLLDIKIELTAGGGTSHRRHMSSSSSTSSAPPSTSPSPSPNRPRASSSGSSSRHSSVCSPPPPPSPPRRKLGSIRIRTGPDGRRRTHISWHNQCATMHNPINFINWFQRVETFLVNTHHTA
jgi:hypothetical protein